MSNVDKTFKMSYLNKQNRLFYEFELGSSYKLEIFTLLF